MISAALASAWSAVEVGAFTTETNASSQVQASSLGCSQIGQAVLVIRHAPHPTSNVSLARPRHKAPSVHPPHVDVLRRLDVQNRDARSQLHVRGRVRSKGPAQCESLDLVQGLLLYLQRRKGLCGLASSATLLTQWMHSWKITMCSMTIVAP